MKVDIKRSDYFYFLLFLIPPFIITGPLLPDSIISIIALIFLFLHYKKIINIIKKDFFFKILFIFCILNVVNSLFAQEQLISLKNSLTYFRFPLFVIAIAYFFYCYSKSIIYFYYSLLFTIIFVSLDGIFQFYMGFNFFGEISFSRNRISGLFGDEFILGTFLTKLTPILISLYFVLNYKVNKTIMVFACLISFITIIFSGERTALAIISIFYFFLFFFILQAPLKKKLLNFGILFLIILSMIFSSNQLKERLVDLTFAQIISVLETNKLEKDLSIDGEEHRKYKAFYLNQRARHLMVSAEIFKEKPIFGHGNKMFGKVCFSNFYINDGRCSTHPHNFSAQILVENGLIGFCLYLILFFILCKAFYKKIILLDMSSSIILLIIILNFFPLFPTGNFYNNMNSIFLYLPLAVYYGYKKELFQKKILTDS